MRASPTSLTGLAMRPSAREHRLTRDHKPEQAVTGSWPAEPVEALELGLRAPTRRDRWPRDRPELGGVDSSYQARGIV